MTPHVKTYLNYYGYGIDDVIMCENCRQRKAVDIHHIQYRSRGGGNDINNLIALCRVCHNQAHMELLSPDYLSKIHKMNL